MPAKKSVLVVEDDLCIREALQEILELDGYHVVTAENGKAGLEKIKEERPSLVLLDFMMPVMGGREFLDNISHFSGLSSIPILVISASTGNQSTQGAREVIKKPLDINLLLNKIESYIGVSCPI